MEQTINSLARIFEEVLDAYEATGRVPDRHFGHLLQRFSEIEDLLAEGAGLGPSVPLPSLAK